MTVPRSRLQFSCGCCNQAGGPGEACSPPRMGLRERGTTRSGPPAPTFFDPRRDRVRICTGVAAQLRGLALARLVQFALARALQDPGYLGEQVSPVVSERAQLPHRGVMLSLGKLAPLCMTLRHAVDPRSENQVSFRPLIDHMIDYDGWSLPLSCCPWLG